MFRRDMGSKRGSLDMYARGPLVSRVCVMSTIHVVL